MGCCYSCCCADNAPVGVLRPPRPIVPRFKSDGNHPGFKPMESKYNPRNNLMITCGGLFVTNADDETMDVLFLYPDAAYAHMGPTDRLEVQPDVTDRGRAKWTSIRVELKEFDSPDDILKEWYDDGGQIPGVLMVEPAGPLGAWARLQPHSYQQRYVLPNGRRVAHPCMDKAFKPLPTLRMTHPNNPAREVSYFSLPQRMHRLYKAHGEEALKSLILRIEERVRQIQVTAVAMLGPTAAATEVIAWGDLILELPTEIEQMKDYTTVHDIRNKRLQPLVDVLAEVEDALLMNWFDVALIGELEIGKYKGIGPNGTIKRANSFWDYLLKKCVVGIDETGDNAVGSMREKLSVTMIEEINKFLAKTDAMKDEGDAPNLVEILFPDLDDIVARAVQCVDFEATGLAADVPLNEKVIENHNKRSEQAALALEKYRQTVEKLPKEKITPVAPPNPLPTVTTIQELLDLRRKLDARSLEERRVELYDQVIAQAEVYSDPEERFPRARFMSELCLRPHLLQKFYHKFTFFLVFPQFNALERDDMLRPNEALLRLWPEGAPYDTAVTLTMTPLFLDPVETRMDSVKGVTNKVQQTFASMTTKGLDEGNSSIDSDDEKDPRNRWIPYPDERFRGYECTAEVAIDCTYFFHFLLDGVLFVDHDSYYLPSGDEGLYGRKVHFSAAVRPYTINPLVGAGMALN